MKYISPMNRELHGEDRLLKVALRVEDRAHDVARVAHVLLEEVVEREAAEHLEAEGRQVKRGRRAPGAQSPLCTPGSR